MADYALAQIVWTRGRPSGQPGEDVMVNTIHFQCDDGGLTGSGCDDFVTAFTTAFTNSWQGWTSEDVSLETIKFYNMPPAAGPLGDPAFTRHPNFFGTADAVGTLPPQDALTVTWITANPRRWGRIYLGGLTVEIVTNGRAVESLLEDLADQMQAFAVDRRDAGQGVVVWARDTWSANDVQELHVDDIFDVQRRRRYHSPLFRNVRSIIA